MKTARQLLGYKPLEVIELKGLKARYHELAFELHPDRNPATDAGEQFAQLTVAYRYLLTLVGVKPTAEKIPPSARQAVPKCTSCHGHGMVNRSIGFTTHRLKCSKCKGTGRLA